MIRYKIIVDIDNKPSIITFDHIRKEKLRMSASEMFFVRYFGLIIGDLVRQKKYGYTSVLFTY